MGEAGPDDPAERDVWMQTSRSAGSSAFESRPVRKAPSKWGLLFFLELQGFIVLSSSWCYQ